MAMTIRNDSGSMMALGQLKKNDSSLEKQLKKVSSGMRTNSAGDDASGYSISERMRTLIRALGQDIQNTKNGKDLVGVAEGGMQDILDNLREMKAMAINSANDHNTDLDRETLEKEFASRKATITDIVVTTNYNGRLLLTGDYAEYHIDYSQGEPATMISGFQPAFNTCYLQPAGTQSGVIGPIGRSITVDSSFRTNGTIWNYWQQIGQPVPTGSDQVYQFAVTMDFSNLATNFPNGIDGKGFSILCEGCQQYIDFVFDASTTITTYTKNPTPPSGEAPNPDARVFTIGVKNVTSAADLAKAVFDGVSTLQNQVEGHDYYVHQVGTTAQNLLIDSQHSLRMAEINGSYYFMKSGPAMQFLNGVYGGPKNVFEDQLLQGTPLIIHTGPKANQHLKIFINGMYPKDLKIEDVHVIPQEAALEALQMLDDAIDYSLNEITRMGAYQMRLGQTEENLVTNEENTQAAESTIRDADMAKEMAGYAKANILTQAAKSMLAQANQNSSNVLNLLK